MMHQCYDKKDVFNFPMQCYTNIITVLILKFKNMFNFQFKKSKNGPKKIDG